MSNFCTHCGNKLEPEALFCPNCGTKVGTAPVQPRPTRPTRPTGPTRTTREPSRPVSPGDKKIGSTALLLCIFLGMFGAHRFYVGKYLTGMLMLCSGGILGVWVLIDLTTIARNRFEDKEGNELEVIHNITPLKETLLIGGTLMVWVALFFSAIAIFLDFSSSSLITVIEGQLTALRNGQIEDAYSYTAQSYQKGNSVDAFKNFVYAHPILLTNVRSSFSERRIMGNRGYARGSLIGKDDTQTAVIYELTKEEGQWKVVNMNIAVPVPNTAAPTQQSN